MLPHLCARCSTFSLQTVITMKLTTQTCRSTPLESFILGKAGSCRCRQYSLASCRQQGLHLRNFNLAQWSIKANLIIGSPTFSSCCQHQAHWQDEQHVRFVMVNCLQPQLARPVDQQWLAQQLQLTVLVPQEELTEQYLNLAATGCSVGMLFGVVHQALQSPQTVRRVCQQLPEQLL